MNDDAEARVWAFLNMTEPHPFQEEFSDVHTLDIADVRFLATEVARLRVALEVLSDSIEGHPANEADEAAMREWMDLTERALSGENIAMPKGAK